MSGGKSMKRMVVVVYVIGLVIALGLVVGCDIGSSLFDETAPGEITDLDYEVLDNGNLKVTWVDPSDEDLATVICTCLSTDESKEVDAGTESVTFVMPLKNVYYGYSFKTEDEAGNSSEAVEISLYKYDFKDRTDVYKSSEDDVNIRWYYLYSYNSDDELLSKTTHMPSTGIVFYSWEYEYNTDGDTTAEYTYSYDSSTSNMVLSSYKTYAYNDDSLYEGYSEYDASDTLTARLVLSNRGQFDAPQTYTYYDGSNTVTGTGEAEYDEHGAVLSFTKYGADGTVEYYREWEYDSTRFNTKVTTYDANDAVTDYFEYSYNSEGDILEEIQYDGSDNKLWRWVHTYSSDSRRTIKAVGNPKKAGVITSRTADPDF